MARWLPLAISKDCGCNSKSVQDSCEMIGLLAPTTSKYVGCSCRSPRDGWAKAGWLALALSNDGGCHFGSLEDGWDKAGRTFVLLEHPIQHTHTNSTTHKSYITNKNQNQLAGWLALANSKTSGVNLHRREMAGRWLGGCP